MLLSTPFAIFPPELKEYDHSLSLSYYSTQKRMHTGYDKIEKYYNPQLDLDHVENYDGCSLTHVIFFRIGVMKFSSTARFQMLVNLPLSRQPALCSALLNGNEVRSLVEYCFYYFDREIDNLVIER